MAPQTGRGRRSRQLPRAGAGLSSWASPSHRSGNRATPLPHRRTQLQTSASTASAANSSGKYTREAANSWRAHLCPACGERPRMDTASMPMPNSSATTRYSEAGHVQRHQRHRDHQQQHRVEHRVHLGDAHAAHRWQHLDAGARVLLLAEDGDRDEVRQLPEEQDAEQDDAGPLEPAGGGGPADQRRERPGHRAHQQRGRALLLHGGVNRHVANQRDRSEQTGEAVDAKGEQRNGDGTEREAKNQRHVRASCARRAAAGSWCASSTDRCRAPASS